MTIVLDGRRVRATDVIRFAMYRHQPGNLLTSKHPSYIINNTNLQSCPMCQSENYSDFKPLNAIYTA